MDTNLRVKRRHKTWPEALKREIVAACAVPGASVSLVARQYDVNTNQVFTWRKLYGSTADAAGPQLMPVVVTPEPPMEIPLAPPANLPMTSLIEIELPGGYRVRVGGDVKAVSLRIVLDALERQ
ncbi:IS66-like element accessory protein TnpA [Acidocella facilis]|uniref:IS66-like element accessory protein TnpA n=1 Tax=Acidocella facilis TaxID=525 RepID=UPI0038D1949D